MTCRWTAFETAWREVSLISVPASAVPPQRVIAVTTVTVWFIKQRLAVLADWCIWLSTGRDLKRRSHNLGSPLLSTCKSGQTCRAVVQDRGRRAFVLAGRPVADVVHVRRPNRTGRQPQVCAPWVRS